MGVASSTQERDKHGAPSNNHKTPKAIVNTTVILSCFGEKGITDLPEQILSALGLPFVLFFPGHAVLLYYIFTKECKPESKHS